VSADQPGAGNGQVVPADASADALVAWSAALWDDNPAEVDLLGFSTVVTPIMAALTAPGLDPLTVGVYGPWGSGKSTVLDLLGQRLRGNRKFVVIETDPWEYEDHHDLTSSSP
jgi:predicted KAP-like P-loop ATPase